MPRRDDPAALRLPIPQQARINVDAYMCRGARRERKLLPSGEALWNLGASGGRRNVHLRGVADKTRGSIAHIELNFQCAAMQCGPQPAVRHMAIGQSEAERKQRIQALLIKPFVTDRGAFLVVD